MNDRSTLVVAEDAVLDACGEVTFPDLGVIEQSWETNPIPTDKVIDRAQAALGSLALEEVPDGGSIAVGVGSRGIGDLPALVTGVVDGLRDRGFNPFVFPAMGSHGGATAAGQREMLASLGVTEDRIGCEIRSSMAVERVGKTADREVPVYAASDAVAADAIIPVNRIKPHTDFDGAVESGLSKMLVIGMGKQRGAKLAHEWAVDWSFRDMIPEITALLLAELPVVGGVAIVENERDDTALVEGIPPEGFLSRERELLELAYDRMPTLPFDNLDVLVVDRVGKDISGQGMDTNVIGRRPFAINEPKPDHPDIKRIYARGLTETTHGNAMGIGSADLVHADVAEAIDTETALVNAITASTVRGVRLPPVVASDRAGLALALSTVGVVDPAEARVLRVTDTMRLDRLYASEALIAEARERSDLRVVSSSDPLTFTDGHFTASTPHEG